jgi:hypothetical protein
MRGIIRKVCIHVCYVCSIPRAIAKRVTEFDIVFLFIEAPDSKNGNRTNYLVTISVP